MKRTILKKGFGRRAANKSARTLTAKKEFAIFGEFVIPRYKAKSAKIIDKQEKQDFWEKHSVFCRRIGVYVFAMRGLNRLTPWYVGKATKSFEKEVFTSRNLNLFNSCLAESRKGTPVLFFLCNERRTGINHAKHIGELEKYLIQVCVNQNPSLLNVVGTKAPEWSVSGILRSKKRPTKGGSRFKKLLGIRKMS
jgi:hypothetical protein